jgi:two-component system, LytTR family, sensor kinase
MFIISMLVFLPLVGILLKNFVFYRKQWDTGDAIQFQLIFWLVRGLLTPLVGLYVLMFGPGINRMLKFLFIQISGASLYEAIHWSMSYGICRILMQTPRNRIWNLSETVFKESYVLNLLVYVITVFLFYMWAQAEKNEEDRERRIRLEKSLALSRLETLQNQLNTHFLFNTMHNISSLILQEKKEEANDTLIRLSELLRFSLKETNEQFITVRREIELTRLYLEIQKIRFRERLEYTVDCDENTVDLMIPPFILQPLVENAIRHAIEPFPNPGHINLAISDRHQMIAIHVTDNGKRRFADIRFNTGIGIANMKERLTQLYGKNFRMDFAPSVLTADGITVSIYLPVLNTADAAL